MGKTKEKSATTTANEKTTTNIADLPRPEYEELITMVNAISKPLASKKLMKKVYKVAKKAAVSKNIRVGSREVCKYIRKKEKGVVIFAGDVSPIDVYSHMPVMCEEHKIPYVFVPCRIDLGIAIQTKRPTCCVMVKKGDDYSELYSEVKDTVKKLPLPL